MTEMLEVFPLPFLSFFMVQNTREICFGKGKGKFRFRSQIAPDIG